MAESGPDSRNRGRSRRDKAILALMTEKTVTEAAFTTARQRIQQLAGRAVDALDELLDAKKHPSVRLGAARTIMEIALYQHDVDSLMGKLNELEQVRRLRKF